MPYDLDDTDLAILKSLQEDGRKSFRQISREIKVSSPTIKTRYERLVNIGLIISVKPEFDLSKIGKREKSQLTKNYIQNLKEQKRHFHVKIDSLKVRIKCEFCNGPINNKPKVLKFANFERFFCCVICRKVYREKHRGRIQSVIEQYNKQRRTKSSR